MIDGLKPYDDYRPSAHPWLGKVPAHWLEKRAKYFFREVDERSTTGQEDLLSVSHKTGVTPRPQHVTMFKAESNVGHKICRPADLAINTMWAFMGALGVSRQVGLVSPSYGIYRPINDGELHPNYVDRLLRTDDYKSEYLCRSTGIRSSRLRLYPDEFLKIPIPCPPPEEQAAIVRFLDHADRRIRRYIRAKRQLIALLNEQKQAIIHQAVTRGLDPHVKLKPSGVEWLCDVPEHWEVARVKGVSEVLRGKFTHRPRNDPSLYDGEYPFIQTGEVARASKFIQSYKQTLNERGFAVSKMFPRGTLVMTIAANIGDVALLDFDACFPDSVVGFVPRHDADKEYLFYLFRCMKSEFLRDAPVNTQGNLNVERISGKPIPVPPVGEQRSIVELIEQSISGLEETIETKQRELELISEYRTRLIADVVTGKLDVREAAAALPDELEAGEADPEELLDDDDTTNDVALDTEPEEVEA